MAALARFAKRGMNSNAEIVVNNVARRLTVIN